MKMLRNLFLVINLISLSAFAQKKTTQSEEKAVSIIRFCNSIISYKNYVSNHLQEYESVLTLADQNVRRHKHKLQALPITCPDIINSAQERLVYQKEDKTAPVFPEKKRLNKELEEAEKMTTSLVVQCEKLNSYFTRNLVENDKEYLQYKVLQDSLKYKTEQAVVLWNKVSDEAIKVGNKAELAVLKNSKLSGIIIPMKEDLTMIRDIWNDLQQATLIRKDIREKNEVFFASIQKNKNINIQDISNKEVYQKFYASCEFIYEYVETLLQKVERGDYKSAEEYYKLIGSEYDKAVASYNAFIQQ